MQKVFSIHDMPWLNVRGLRGARGFGNVAHRRDVLSADLHSPTPVLRTRMMRGTALACALHPGPALIDWSAEVTASRPPAVTAIAMKEFRKNRQC